MRVHSINKVRVIKKSKMKNRPLTSWLKAELIYWLLISASGSLPWEGARSHIGLQALFGFLEDGCRITMLFCYNCPLLSLHHYESLIEPKWTMRGSVDFQSVVRQKDLIVAVTQPAAPYNGWGGWMQIKAAGHNLTKPWSGFERSCECLLNKRAAWESSWHNETDPTCTVVALGLCLNLIAKLKKSDIEAYFDPLTLYAWYRRTHLLCYEQKKKSIHTHMLRADI